MGARTSRGGGGGGVGPKITATGGGASPGWLAGEVAKTKATMAEAKAKEGMEAARRTAPIAAKKSMKGVVIRRGGKFLYNGKPVTVVENGGPDNIVITGKGAGILGTIEVSRGDLSPM